MPKGSAVRLLLALWCPTALLFLLRPPDSKASPQESRVWTPEDSIKATYLAPSLGGAGKLTSAPYSNRPLCIAPDGRHFAFVTWSGDLQQDAIIANLYIFSKVTGAVSGIQNTSGFELKYQSSVAVPQTNAGGCLYQDACWWNNTLYFVNMETDGKSGLWEITMTSDPVAPRCLFVCDSPLFLESVSDEGVIASFRRKIPVPPDYPMGPYEEPGYVTEKYAVNTTILFVSKTGLAHEMSVKDGPLIVVFPSPRGDAAVVRAMRYDFSAVKYLLVERNVWRITELTDWLPSDQVGNEVNGVAWLSNDVVVYPRLLKNPTPRVGLSAYAWQRGLDISKGADDYGRLLRWEAKGGVLAATFATHDGAEQRINLTVTEDGWLHARPQLSPVADKHGPENPPVVVRQSKDSSPVIQTVEDEVLFRVPGEPPDVIRTPVETFVWLDAGGRRHECGLLIPSGVKAGTRIPLVVQVYAYSPDFYKPDGNSPGGIDCAQSLTAVGIAVVLMETGNLPGGAEEFPAFRDQFCSMIRALRLDHRFSITGIGVTGFSHGGALLFDLIPNDVAGEIDAAVCVDFTSTHYSSYLQQIGHAQTELARAATENMRAIKSRFLHKTINDSIAGGNFWKEKGKWLQTNPEFTSDQIRCPILLSHHRGGEHLDEKTVQFFEQIGMLTATQRPFDFVVFPQGLHLLMRPKERYAEMRLVVDWMCFWLKGEIPSDPERAARWAVLRKQQDEVLKTPPPPKGHWEFVLDAVQPAWTPPESSKPAAGAEEKKPAAAEPESEQVGAGK